MSLCVICGAEGKYKCPSSSCRAPSCSLACFKSHKEACSKHDEKEEQVISREGGSDASRQQQQQQQPSPAPTRPFEEEEDEDCARLRRNHLLSVATSDSIRAALRDDRLVDTVTRIDAAVRAEQALDAACENPVFREFTEKILDTISTASATTRGGK